MAMNLTHFFANIIPYKIGNTWKFSKRRSIIDIVAKVELTPFLRITMNDDGLFSRCHATQNGIGERFERDSICIGGEGYKLPRYTRERGESLRLENFLEFRGWKIWQRYGDDRTLRTGNRCYRCTRLDRNKSGSIKVKERDEGIFFFFLIVNVHEFSFHLIGRFIELLLTTDLHKGDFLNSRILKDICARNMYTLHIREFWFKLKRSSKCQG